MLHKKTVPVKKLFFYNKKAAFLCKNTVFLRRKTPFLYCIIVRKRYESFCALSSRQTFPTLVYCFIVLIVTNSCTLFFTERKKILPANFVDRFFTA